MKTQMYIPKTITVGFQRRSDTFTGKLGYVIYTDHTGKLRKETSWNGWRNKDIEPVTFNNDPTNGFTFNKGVQRDGHWGSGRSVIRVWDPRDFEFEISVDNLIGILMHSDVSKRDITQPCVFAWYGTELVLLPTNSKEYEESVQHTSKQTMKVSSKELVPGYTYALKKDDTNLVYLGHYDTYADVTLYEENPDNRRYGYSHGTQHVKRSKKSHVFSNPDGTYNRFVTKEPNMLALCVSEEVDPRYPSLVEEFFTTGMSQPYKGYYIKRGDAWNRTKFQLRENVFVGVTAQLQLHDPNHRNSYFYARPIVLSTIEEYERDTDSLLCDHVANHSHGRGHGRKRVTSVDLSDPQVTEHIKQMNDAWKQINAEHWEEYKNASSYDEKRKIAQEASQKFEQQFHLGMVKPILQNGHKL